MDCGGDLQAQPGPGVMPRPKDVFTMVTPKQQSFADIREITEMAADVRRLDVPGVVTKE